MHLDAFWLPFTDPRSKDRNCRRLCVLPEAQIEPIPDPFIAAGKIGTGQVSFHAHSAQGDVGKIDD